MDTKNFFKFIVTSLAVSFFVISCGSGSGSDPDPDPNGISIDGNKLRIEASLNYDPVGGPSIKEGVKTVYGQRIDTFSSVIEIDSSSTASQNARVEADIRLAYQPNNSIGKENLHFIVMRVREYGQVVNPTVQAFMGMCLDASCNSEIYIEPPFDIDPNALVNLSPINDWSTPTDITVAWNDTQQEFEFTYDGKTIGLPIDTFNNHAGVISKGISFNRDNFSYAEIRVAVKNVNINGDSGKLIAYLDNVEINNVLFDDFTASKLDTNKWLIAY